MAKRKKMPTDLNQRAKAIVDFATSDEPGDEKDEARAAGGSQRRSGPSEQALGGGTLRDRAQGCCGALGALETSKRSAC